MRSITVGSMCLQVWTLQISCSRVEKGCLGFEGLFHARDSLILWACHLRVSLQGFVRVGAVDADQHRDLGGRYSVRGFPTIKVSCCSVIKTQPLLPTGNAKFRGK